MSDLARRFRARVVREMGAVGPGQRYSAVLRRLAVRYWERAREQGESLGSAARSLGVRQLTLQRWVETEGHGFQPVTVVDDASAGAAITLVLAEGVRVECSSVEQAAALLRALR